MSFLLDTCAISELTAAKPNESFVEWFRVQNERTLFLSVITIGELEKGIRSLSQGQKRAKLELWLSDEVIPRFQDRILDIGQRTMTVWARTSVELKTKGLTRPSFDSLLEATALENDLVFVTRNEKNFKGSSVTLLNPWLGWVV